MVPVRFGFVRRACGRATNSWPGGPQMTPGFSDEPRHDSYDVAIVGGAIMGASTAWFLVDNPDYDGRVLVIERDSSYRDTSTMTTTSCMRQQFSTELNVKIAQFAADFVKNLRRHLQGIPDVPQLSIRSFGYMYLAATEGFAERLRTDCLMQRAARGRCLPDDTGPDRAEISVLCVG